MHEGHFLTQAFNSDVFKIMMGVMLFVFGCGAVFLLAADRRANAPLAPSPDRLSQELARGLAV